MTYTSSGTTLTLESAAFPGGVIRATGSGAPASQEVNYFLTDHLGSVRAIVDWSGNVKERNDYYAFGAKHVRPDYPQNTNRYDYNGKEEQTTGDLKFLDYGARMYDARIGRWFCVDPLTERRPMFSPYAYCGDNPVSRIDPDGRDYRIYFTWDSHGNLTGLRFETTIYIYGDGTSSDTAERLTAFAKTIFLADNGNGKDVEITFDIRYVYLKDPLSYFTLSQPGDNLMEFTGIDANYDDLSDGSKRSHVKNGWRAKIFNERNADPRYVVMHETGHMLGLSDRWEIYDPENLGPIFSAFHKGYKSDIMGNPNSEGHPDVKIGFDRSHYEHYRERFGPMLPLQIHVMPVSAVGKIDKNSKGELKTPYEDGGIHKRVYGFKLIYGDFR